MEPRIRANNIFLIAYLVAERRRIKGMFYVYFLSLVPSCLRERSYLFFNPKFKNHATGIFLARPQHSGRKIRFVGRIRIMLRFQAKAATARVFPALAQRGIQMI